MKNVTQECSECKQVKDLVFFGKRDKGVRYRKQCKLCRYTKVCIKNGINQGGPKGVKSKYNSLEERQEIARIRAREWYKNNTEKAKKRIAAWKKTEYGKRKAKERRDRSKKLNPRYWRAKIRHDRSIRRLREKSDDPIFVSSILIIESNNIEKYGEFTCEYCFKTINDVYHLDHILPLSRGGKNNIENLCISCKKCNLEKGNKTIEEYQKWKIKQVTEDLNPPAS